MSGIGRSYTAVSDPTFDPIDGITLFYKWDGPITYSFPTTDTVYVQYPAGDTLVPGFFQATAAQQTFVRAYLEGLGTSEFAAFSVEGFTNLDISEDTTPDSEDNIRVANTTDPALTTARVADFPSDTYNNVEEGDDGDVWFGDDYPSYLTPQVGTYSGLTHLHELGHALGLAHGHSSDGYGTLPASIDAMEYTVMTYRSYLNGPTTGYTNETFGYAQSWMMLDIAALQNMYGADFTANSGDTNYSFDPTTGAMTIDGQTSAAPGANRIFLTIWDGDGNDTYDFSNYATDLEVDLNPGSFSILSSTQLSNLGGGNFAQGNVYNALQFNGDARSLIENANGGSGNDELMGNDAANALDGNGGDDTMTGGAGADTLDGDGGNDQFYMSTGGDTINGGADTDEYNATGGGDLDNEVITVVVDSSGNGTVAKTGEGSTDTVTSIETFVADEAGGDNDSITIQGDLTTAQIAGLSDASVGTFTPSGGGGPVAFGGGGGQPVLSALLGADTPGTYQITSGDEAGTVAGITFSNFETINFNMLCFAAGTQIATPTGETSVETLEIGDMVRTEEGRAVPVKWIGRQTIAKRFAGLRAEMVRIDAGTLGNHSDLTVTADHGMIIDGLVVNASALVNGTTINYVPLSETADSFVVYHVETEHHDVIIANGALSETYLDTPGRSIFDNAAEYDALYGKQSLIAENPAPRIHSARLLPAPIRARLGIELPSTLDLIALAG